MSGIRTVETGVPRLLIHVLRKRDSEMIFLTDAEATLSDRRKPQRPEPAVTCVVQTCESSSWSLVVSVTLLWTAWHLEKEQNHALRADPSQVSGRANG